MKAIAVVALALFLTSIVASPARADTTCSFAAGVLNVDYTNGPDFNGGQATMRVTSDHQRIEVLQGGVNQCPVTATLDDVDSIDWDDTSTDNPNEIFIDLVNGGFVKPGVILGDTEIPIDIAAGAQNDLVLLNGTDGVENFRYGAGGVNLNAGESALFGNVIDADLTLSGVEFHTVNGRGGNDILSGAGGAGTGAVFAGKLDFNADAGNDTVTGGDGGDDLTAESSSDPVGNDTVSGGAGNDHIISAGGNDSIQPGSGIADILNFQSGHAGMRLDLAVTGPQQTGIGTLTVGNGFDRVFGTFFGDTMFGTASGEEINGQSGDDTVIGRGGADKLGGSSGRDQLLPRDNLADDVECGTEADTVAVELVAPDPDTIDSDCETRTKIDTSVTSGPPALTAARVANLVLSSNETGVTFECSLDGGPFTGCPAAYTTPALADGKHTLSVRSRDRLGFADATAASRSWTVDGTAPVLSGLTASRLTFRLGRGDTALTAARRRRARRGTRISFSSSEAGSARILLTPLLKGRKVGKRCLRATRKRRKRKRCTRLGRVTTLSRAVKAGANTIRFTGRIGGKALKPGRYRIDVSLADGLGNRSRSQRLIVRVVK